MLETRQRMDDVFLRSKYEWLIEREMLNWKEARNNLPFTKIQLERTFCFGTCPVYTVTFHRDGRAVYEGRDYVTRKGRHVGSVHFLDFGRLCYFIELIRFDKFEVEYTIPATDLPSTLVTVDNGKQSITTKDYGDVAPVEFWALANLIDAVAERIEWKSEK